MMWTNVVQVGFLLYNVRCMWKVVCKGKNSSICLKANLHSQDYVRTMLIEFSLPSTCYVWFAWEGAILVIAMCLPTMKLGQLLRIEQLV